MSRVAFDDEMDPRNVVGAEQSACLIHRDRYRDTTISIMRLPYGVLRAVRQTVEGGGYLTSNVFVPKQVWKQFGVKLSGVSTKMSVFGQLIQLIEEHIETLCFPEDDPDSVALIQQQFRAFITETQQLQNHLSKPFPFIREVNASSTAGGDGGGAANFSGTPSSSASAGGGSKWTSMVAGLGKSVVKYAEVGYQRFGAMTSRVSDEEFTSYSTLIVILCEKAQVFLTTRSSTASSCS